MTRPEPVARDHRTLASTLEEAAARHPDHLAVVDEDGDALSYAELLTTARELARGFLCRGLKPGDRLAMMMDNHTDHVRVWTSAALAGLVVVPLNTAFRGGMLRQVLEDAAPRALVCDGDHVAALADVDAFARADLVVLRGEVGQAPADAVALHDVAGADTARDDVVLPAVADRDVMQILFTSGTTGRSKGVSMTQAHLHTFCDPTLTGAPTPEDRMLVCLPLFHVAGQWSVYTALRAGASAVLRKRFSASAFWQQVDELACTTTLLLGAMADFLMKQPGSPDDGTTSLDRVWLVPVIPEVREFERRFGVRTATYYGSTEASNVLNAEFGSTRPSACGVPRPGVEVRLVDEHDLPVGEGSVGELVLRATEPWEVMTGYLDLPEATADAFRNGWLHTGDLFRVLEDGQYAFVDRKKDSLRRRGENVSSYEVEREAMAIDGVLEAAVVGVPSEHTEDDILLCAVVGPCGPSEAELWTRLAERLPYFMVPRFVELLDGLPRTATQKIGKAALRDRGAVQAWDSEAEGLTVGRAGVRRRTAPRA